MLSILANLNTITFSAIQILLFTMFPFIAESLHLSISLVVGLFSLGSFLFLWSGPYWASRSDSLGRVQVLTIGMAGLLISFLILILLVTFSSSLSETFIIVTLTISRLFYGLLAAAIIPVSQALQLDLTTKEKYMKSMLSNSIGLNLGRMFGPIYVLLNGDSPEKLMKGVLLWVCLLFLLNLFSKKTKPLHAPLDAPPAKDKMIFDWKLWQGELKWVFILALLFTSFIGTLHNTFGVHLKELFSLNTSETSILMAKFLLGSSLMAIFTQMISKRFFRNPWQGPLIIGAVALFIGSMGFAFGSTNTQIWFSMLTISIGIAMIPPSYLTLTTIFSPKKERGRKFGMINASNTIGYTLGGIFTALTLKIFSHNLALIITTSILVSAIVLTIIILQNKKLSSIR